MEITRRTSDRNRQRYASDLTCKAGELCALRSLSCIAAAKVRPAAQGQVAADTGQDLYVAHRCQWQVRLFGSVSSRRSSSPNEFEGSRLIDGALMGWLSTFQLPMTNQ
jgi:hypothetical protein